eukprot:403370267
MMLQLVTVGLVLTQVLANPQIYDSAASKKFLSQSFEMPKYMSEPLNNRPLIGVLTQPLSDSQKADPAYAGKSSYIMASYIHYLESAGARTVPLIYDGDLDTELAKIDKLNGVFYCGGGAEGDYDVFGKKVFLKVKQMNDDGNHMPIWGTCLGFQDLAMYSADNSNSILESFPADDNMSNLKFLVDPKTTKMFSILGADANVFENYNITYNHHNWGVSPDKFKTDKGLSSIFYPTSISKDNNGKSYVSSMESNQYPFFATQFHPEKAQFVFYPKTQIDHSTTAIFYNRYFSDFFVNQCKLNNNNFASFEEEQSLITENYKAVVSAGYDGIDYAFP